MKRVKNLIKNNIKLLIGIIIGGVLFGGMGAYAATVAASSVTYTSNGQSTVNGALDELYTRASKWLNPSYFTNLGLDMSNIKMNTAKNIIASKSGILF